MDTLRVNCPWDAKQTHESLAPYLLEECYEALEALEDGDPAALRDELGDVLLQVVFHARVAAERTDGTGFTIDDVATGIVDKLIRRHPHVFSDVKVSGAEDVKRNWDAIKAAERGGREGALPTALGSVPFGQPALYQRLDVPGFQALGAHVDEAHFPQLVGDERQDAFPIGLGGVAPVAVVFEPFRAARRFLRPIFPPRGHLSTS